MRLFVLILVIFFTFDGIILAELNMEISDMNNLIKKDESDIDLLVVSLSISKILNSELDVLHKQNYVSEIVAKINEKIKTETDPKKKLRIFSSILHNTYGFTIPDKPLKISGPEYGMIDFVLSKKKGNCLGLVTLYLIIADKLNIPIKALTIHSHILLVYEDNQTKFYIETTTKGTIHDNLEYLNSHVHLTNFDKIGGRDLHPFGKKELIADMFYNAGLIQDKIGHSDKSVGSYEMALKFNNNHDDAYRAWGDILSQIGDYENAIDKFEKSIFINPNNDAAYTNMGIALNNLERFNEAISTFETSNKINKNNAYTYLNWGIALLCIGDYNESKLKLNIAKELDPNLTSNVKRLMKLME